MFKVSYYYQLLSTTLTSSVDIYLVRHVYPPITKAEEADGFRHSYDVVQSPGCVQQYDHH